MSRVLKFLESSEFADSRRVLSGGRHHFSRASPSTAEVCDAGGKGCCRDKQLTGGCSGCIPFMS